MSTIKLFSDSTCDLPKEDIEGMDVGIVPLIVTFDGDVYYDGVDITPSDLFNIVDKRNMLPNPTPVIIAIKLNTIDNIILYFTFIGIYPGI